MVVDPREQHLRRREDAVEAGRRWQEIPSSAAEALTYWTVTRRRVAAMQCLIASASSARGTRRLIGMSLQRGVRPLLERGRKWIAASRGQPRAQLGWRVVCGAFCKGSRLERRASFGAWSEKASRTEGSACSSVRTCSASPDVETVTCDTGTASPAAGVGCQGGCQARRRAPGREREGECTRGVDQHADRL